MALIKLWMKTFPNTGVKGLTPLCLNKKTVTLKLLCKTAPLYK